MANGTSGLNAQVVSGRLNMKNYGQIPNRERVVSTAHSDLPARRYSLFPKADLVYVSRLKDAFWVATLGHAYHGSAQKFGRGDVLREQPS